MPMVAEKKTQTNEREQKKMNRNNNNMRNSGENKCQALTI